MRPVALMLQGMMAVASAAIGKAFAPPRILPKYHQGWRRLTIDRAVQAPPWTVIAGRQQRRLQLPVALGALSSQRQRRSSKSKAQMPFAKPPTARASMVVSQSLESSPSSFAAVDDALNDSQRAAVLSEVGAMRVVAGPGSGKTRVLTRRIAHLVRAESIAERFTRMGGRQLPNFVARVP